MKNYKFAVSALVCAGVLAGASVLYAADPEKGAAIYNNRCVDCHGSTGEGQMPGVPDFKRTRVLFQPDTNLAQTIKTGKNVMPGFAGVLTQEQINDVIAYLRTLH